MLNAINKYIFIPAMMLCAACSGGESETEAAKQLYSNSEAAIASRNYAQAIELLDTLNSRYPTQTAVRRDALRLRAQALEGMATDSIAVADRELAEATLAVQNLQGQFRHVESNVGLEGYYLPKGTSDKVMMATGVQARVLDSGHFYMVANVQGQRIGIKGLRFGDGADAMESTPIDASRVIVVEGSESASFTPEDLEPVSVWLSSHPSFGSLSILGRKGNAKVTVTPALRNEIVQCYQYGKALQRLRLAQINREKFERMLATARDQLANLPLPSSENQQQQQ